MNTAHRILNSLLDPAKYQFGFADMRGLLPSQYGAYSCGIAIIRRLNDDIVDGIADGPTRAYLRHYEEINTELNQIVEQTAEQLNACGIESIGIPATLSDAQLNQEHRRTLSSDVSHKQVATRAGLGWIGKCDLLITNRFGPRVRLASVLTVGPFEAGKPIDESRCGDCSLCVDQCPAKAASGALWNINLHRDEFFDATKCRAYCRRVSEERLGVCISLCGKCVSVCPNWS